MRALTDGLNENYAHFAMDKVEQAIEQDDPTTARQMLRQAIEHYTKLIDPIAYTNAANRHARLAEKVADSFAW